MYSHRRGPHGEMARVSGASRRTTSPSTRPLLAGLPPMPTPPSMCVRSSTGSMPSRRRWGESMWTGSATSCSRHSASGGTPVPTTTPGTRNSDQVLDRRLGIPISISVLLMEIARRCGVPLVGVGMPGHFLVTCWLGPPHRPLLRRDAPRPRGCARLLHSVAGRLLVDLPDAMLASVGKWALLSRMLANLDHSFRRRGGTESVRWVTRLRAAIPGQSLAEHVAVGRRSRRAGML